VRGSRRQAGSRVRGTVLRAAVGLDLDDSPDPDGLAGDLADEPGPEQRGGSVEDGSLELGPGQDRGFAR
jgi:hypothetical protein